jgi:hypothetical protein
MFKKMPLKFNVVRNFEVEANENIEIVTIGLECHI